MQIPTGPETETRAARHAFCRRGARWPLFGARPSSGSRQRWRRASQLLPCPCVALVHALQVLDAHLGCCGQWLRAVVGVGTGTGNRPGGRPAHQTPLRHIPQDRRRHSGTRHHCTRCRGWRRVVSCGQRLGIGPLASSCRPGRRPQQHSPQPSDGQRAAGAPHSSATACRHAAAGLSLAVRGGAAQGTGDEPPRTRIVHGQPRTLSSTSATRRPPPLQHGANATQTSGKRRATVGASHWRGEPPAPSSCRRLAPTRWRPPRRQRHRRCCHHHPPAAAAPAAGARRSPRRWCRTGSSCWRSC